MEGLTALVALMGFLLAFTLKPHKALVVYCAVLFAYPGAMTISMGDVSWNAPRIVAIGLFANAAFKSGGWKRLRWSWLDTFIMLSYLMASGAAMANAPVKTVLIRQVGGGLFDAILPYLSARMALDRRENVFTFSKGLVYIGLPLAVMGVIESITGHSIYDYLTRYYGFGLGSEEDIVKQMRQGFYRASGAFGVSILMGLFFAALATSTLGLWNSRTNWSNVKVGLFFCILVSGVLSSMSSAPLFALFVGLCMVMVFRLRQYWPALAVAVFACILFVEIYSNRHFYYVLTYLSFDTKTAWYRIALINETFGGGMTGHWLLGYGYVGIGPGNDNTNFFWEHQDLTNIYIATLVRFGLVGLLPGLIVNVLYYYRLYKAAHSTNDPNDLWYIWCISSALVGWNVAMMTVAAFRQIDTYQHLLIALSQNLPLIVSQNAPGMAHAPAPATAFNRRPWRYSHARHFSGNRQLERPELPAQMPELPPDSYSGA